MHALGSDPGVDTGWREENPSKQKTGPKRPGVAGMYPSDEDV
jgi:hypothetical protein